MLSAGPRRAAQLLTEHAEILARIQAGDAGGAAAALEEHLRAARAMA